MQLTHAENDCRNAALLVFVSLDIYGWNQNQRNQSTTDFHENVERPQ